MMARAFKDESGNRYGRLTVLSFASKVGKTINWNVRCECGNEKTVSGASLRAGHTKSCGCLVKDVRRADAFMRVTHGLRYTPTYRSWAGMIQRCENPKNPAYYRYGALGVSVCERWHTFENFFADMGEAPAGLSLDRFPNNRGNYEPGNCRWASDIEQSQNQKTNRIITYANETLCLEEWARRVGLNRMTLACRLNAGWSIERALTAPVGPQNGKRSSIAGEQRAITADRARNEAKSADPYRRAEADRAQAAELNRMPLGGYLA